jgi:hypothetical protein
MSSSTQLLVGVVALVALRFASPAQSDGTLRAQGLTPPVTLTSADDQQRQRDLLKISGMPPGASGSNPATYDEATANPYPVLPDPLTLKNGRKVTSASTWRRERRPQLLEDFQRDIYGRTPKQVPKVTWTVARTEPGMNGDVAVVVKQLVGKVDNSAYPMINVNILASLTTPAAATGPVPVIIQFGGGPTAAALNVQADPNPCAPPAPPAGRGAPPAGRANTPPPAARGPVPAAAPPPTWQQQILARGWGYANLNTGSVQADCGPGLTWGIIGLVNKGQPRQLDDWGALSAWGWGASRLLDYFATDKAVDATRVGVTGHSRAGKAALVAMAFAERFAIGYISSSGQGGAKLHRRKYGETIENLATGFYYWVAGNYMKFTGRWDTMPVDSHELIALVAPRPVFISAGNSPTTSADGTFQANDAWVDAKGSFLAAAGASPVYELLGRRGLGVTAFPPIDTAIIDGDLGFRQHTGGHTPEPTWPTFLTFAARYLSVR